MSEEKDFPKKFFFLPFPYPLLSSSPLTENFCQMIDY